MSTSEPSSAAAAGGRRPAEPTARGRAVALVLLLLATALAYARLRAQAFVTLDDPEYVYANPHVTSGLSFANLRWAFTTGEQANWHPLTWLSLQLDVALFGVDAGAMKLVNLALHLLSTALLATLLFRWTRAWWPSLFVAAVFALHPLHVESVAWVAERKDALSHAAFVLALHAWTRAVETGRRRDRALALLVFACGLAAKPMLVTLPFLLLVLELWPFAELRRAARGAAHPAPTWRARVLELAPFFALALASSITTFAVQRAGGAVVSVESAGLGVRAANAVVAYARYAVRAVWPSELSVLHGPRASSALEVGVSALFLAALAVWAWRRRSDRPWRFVGLAWFFGTLVPVIGLVQVGYQSIANRYTYLPLTGLAIVLAFEVQTLLASRPKLRAPAAALAALALAALGIRTRAELAHWDDGVVLFRRALAIEPGDHVVRRQLANALEEAGRHAEASAELEQASADVQRTVRALLAQARVLEQKGEPAEALRALAAAIQLAPRLPAPHLERASLQARLGRGDEALAEVEELLARDPTIPEAHALAGRLRIDRGEFERAADAYAQAALLLPGDARARRAALLSACEAGRVDAATTFAGGALRDDAEALAALGRARERAAARSDAAAVRAIDAALAGPR